MNKWGNRSVIAVGLIATLGVSGCSSIATGTGAVGGAIGVKDRTTASAVGGGILGCGLGTIAGVLHNGVFGAIAGCAVGAVGGATIGAVASEKVQLDEQRKAAQVMQTQLNATNASVHVLLETKKVPEMKDGKPTSKEIEAWDHTVIPLPAGPVRQHSPSIAAVIAKAGVLASQSTGKNPVVIDVYSRSEDHAWISSILDTAIPDGSPVRYHWHQAATPSLVLSPIPVVATAAGTQH